jgi:hypothetical protein
MRVGKEERESLDDDMHDPGKVERINKIASEVHSALAFKNCQECVEALGLVLANIFVEGKQKKKITFELNDFKELITDLLDYYVVELKNERA